MRPVLPAYAAAAAATLLLAACASTPAARAPVDPGLAAYTANCLACHQADGGGVRGLQPPLVGSAWLRGDGQALTAFVLTGGFDSGSRKESANINTMPPFAHLDDATLSTILTYVRARFGENARPVTPEQVAAARALMPPKP